MNLLEDILNFDWEDWCILVPMIIAAVLGCLLALYLLVVLLK